MANVALIAVPVLLAVLVLGPLAARLRQDRGTPTQPLRAVTGLYGRYLVLYVVLAAIAAVGYVGGGAIRGSFCVATGFPTSVSAIRGPVAKPGAWITGDGTVTACALHPGAAQWALYLLTKLPVVLLWASILLLVWQLIRTAERTGPFTPQVSALMWQLGWTVIAGAVLAGMLRQLGVDLLTGMLMTPRVYGPGFTAVDVLVGATLRALFPVALLAGAGLLSFARIIRLGAAMDEEIKATV
jgi:hypothetical protein